MVNIFKFTLELIQGMISGDELTQWLIQTMKLNIHLILIFPRLSNIPKVQDISVARLRQRGLSQLTIRPSTSDKTCPSPATNWNSKWQTPSNLQLVHDWMESYGEEPSHNAGTWKRTWQDTPKNYAMVNIYKWYPVWSPLSSQKVWYANFQAFLLVSIHKLV